MMRLIWNSRFVSDTDLREPRLSRSSGPRISELGLLLFSAALILGSSVAVAYPPAPHHLIYGSVRDEMGNPLVATNAEVILETLSGVHLKAPVMPGLQPGANYRLPVPMDAGLTSDAYKPTALRPTLPFRMKVKIGAVTYLPIQMTGACVNLGQAAESTRLDLTLGEDSDGDGLPDAWERALLSGNSSLQDITPDGDADQDGLSNLQEYLAGTYAFDAKDGLRLDIVVDNGRPVIEFLSIAGRTYSLHASGDLQNWAPIPFRVADEGPQAPARGYYQASDVRRVRLEAAPADGHTPDLLFLRAQVQ